MQIHKISTLNTNTRSVLVVSRDSAILASVQGLVPETAWQVAIASSGLEALERVQGDDVPDLVILDVAGRQAESLHLLRWLHRVRPELPVFLISDCDDENEKLEAFRLGAQEYIVRPFAAESLKEVIDSCVLGNKAGDIEAVDADVERLDENSFLLCASAHMRRIRAQAELLAHVDVPVLLVGEKSTGKETLARFVHQRSVRSGFKFCKLRCHGLSADALRHELFANDSAANAAKSVYDNNGTLLLAGLTAMPAATQSVLLDYLQQRNGPQGNGAGMRVMASVDANFEEALGSHSLRHDLFLKLSAFTIHVPALRQRREEIPALLNYFMDHLARRYGLEARAFSSALMSECQNHTWPGNMEDLQTFVKRFLVTGDEDLVRGDLERSLSPEPSAGKVVVDLAIHGDQKPDLRSIVQNVKVEAERNAIAAALEHTGWNRKAAARLLSVSYRTILYKIQQYGITPLDASGPVAYGTAGVHSSEN